MTKSNWAKFHFVLYFFRHQCNKVRNFFFFEGTLKLVPKIEELEKWKFEDSGGKLYKSFLKQVQGTKDKFRKTQDFEKYRVRNIGVQLYRVSQKNVYTLWWRIIS